MKSSSQSPVSQVLVLSFVLFASLFLFVNRTGAQDIGTVINPDGTTTTTERDTRYGTYGVKVTTKDSKGRVVLEEWKGNKNDRGDRITLEANATQFYDDGTKAVFNSIFLPSKTNFTGRKLVTQKIVKYDALGGVTSEENTKYDESGTKQTEGTKTIFSPSGKKTTQKFDPNTGKYENVEPPKKDEPREPPADDAIEDTGFELFGGLTYMRAPDESAKNLVGFNGSLFYDFTPHVAVGADFMGAFGDFTGTAGSLKFDTSLHRFTYVFGPQFNFHPNDKVKVFVHPLFGGVHDTTKTTFGTMSVSSSANAFAMQLGGGVDVRVTPHVSVRIVQADYLPTHFGGNWQNNFRISTGVVIRF
jgi:opacity protein-like surface antigen